MTNGQEKPAPQPESYDTAAEKLKGYTTAQRRHVEAAKKKRREVSEVITSRRFGPGGDFMRAILQEILKKPIEAHERAGKAKLDLDTFNEEMSDAAIPHERKIDNAAAIAREYLRKMTASSERGHLTPEIMLKMSRNLSLKVTQIVRLLLEKENKDLMPILRWVLDLEPEEEGEKHDKEKYFQILIGKGKFEQDSEVASVGWTIVALMSSEDRIEFSKTYAKGKTEEEIVAFLERGNLMGALGPSEMEEIHPGILDDPEKKDQYAEIYKRQHDFAQAAQHIIKEPLYSRNTAGEMLTLKNTGLFIAEVAAVTTVVANIITTFYASGGFKRPGAGLVAALKNPYVWWGTGVFALARHIQKGDKTLGDVIESKEERDTKARRHAARQLKIGTESNNGWREFFVQEQYAGATVFSEFVDSLVKRDEKINKKGLTVAAFYKWLKRKTETSQDKEKYQKLLDQFKETADGFTLRGYKIQNYEVARFVEAFIVRNIGGDEVQVQYETALKEA